MSAGDGARLEGVTQFGTNSTALEPRFGPTPASGQNPFTCQSSFGWRILFAGREWDPGNRTYWNRQRVYAPEEGRFLSRDPMGYDYGLDQYAYCMGNPVNYLDRSGGWPEWFEDALDSAGDALDDIESGIWDGVDHLEQAYVEVSKEVEIHWQSQVWAFKTGAAQDSLIGYTSHYSNWISDGLIPTFHDPCNENQALGAEVGHWATTTTEVVQVVAGRPRNIRIREIFKHTKKKEVVECVLKMLNSFPAGTLVLTPVGMVPIEDVMNGEAVIARDPDSNDPASEFCVVGLMAHEGSELVEIELESGSRLASTPEHPFWVEGTGWLDAGYLRPGMDLLTAEGTTIAIASVKHICEPQMVYNLSVQSVEVFYVGDEQVLVHNAKKQECGPESPSGAANAIRRGQGPGEITRIDGPNSAVPGQQWHAHGHNGGALNQDGSVHDSDPGFGKRTLEWLRRAGWRV